MKIKKTFLTSLTFLACGAVAIVAPVPIDAQFQGDQLKKKETLRPVKGGEGARPEAPSRVYIVCTYTTGSISFVLPASIYSTTVDLSNDWYTWSGFVTRDQPVLEIPDLEGTYTIKCNADDGKTYTGTLEF